MNSMSRQEKLWWGVVVVILVGAWLVMGISAYAETICVPEPIIPGNPVSRKLVREHTIEVLKSKGVEITDCVHADQEMLLQPLHGYVVTHSFFIMQDSGFGTVDFRREDNPFYSWTVALYPQGRILSSYRHTGVSLDGEIKRAARKVLKQSIRGRKSG